MKKLFLALLILISISYGKSQNVVAVIIDGARYTETFGDSLRRYIPGMDSLSRLGSIVDQFYNNHKTYTSAAIPALLTGSWAGTRDTVYNGQSTQYCLRPSIFEYFRKQKQAPDSDAIYALKYVTSLWLLSFDKDYGPQYWPMTVSQGENDVQVMDSAIGLLKHYHPQFAWIYLADVDHAGHTGIWQQYVSAIKTADSLVFVLWDFLQNDSIYKNTTYLFVTNDHGRHDDQHGGFQNHGCSCLGCRHIMFLALGPGIKQNYVSEKNYETQDFTPTLAYVLGVTPDKADGSVIGDVFTAYNITAPAGRDVNFSIKNNTLIVTSDTPITSNISLYDIKGSKVADLGVHKIHKTLRIKLPHLPQGVYVVVLSNGSWRRSKQIVLY